MPSGQSREGDPGDFGGETTGTERNLRRAGDRKGVRDSGGPRLRPEGALISEIANQLGRSLGELFRIIVVLEQLGYLRKSSTTDRYTVAFKLLELAHRATPAQDLLRAALPEMQVLALEAGQSCHLVVSSGGKGMVIAREEQPGTRGFALKTGAQIDIINSCSGQAILAFNLQHTERIVRAAEEERDIKVDRKWLADRIAIIRGSATIAARAPLPMA